MKVTKKLLKQLRTTTQLKELMLALGEPDIQSRAPSDYRYYLFTRYVLAEKNFPTCVECGSAKCILNKKTLDFRRVCSRACSGKFNGKNLKQKMLARYGVVNPSQLESVKKKKRKTCQERYGVDYPQQSAEIRKTLQQNNIRKYGVTNVSQVQAVKDKRQATFVERFGGNPWQNEEVKTKIKQTHLRLRGVEHPMKSQEVRQKLRRTFLRKFGATSPAGNPKVRAKMRATVLSRFGVPHQSQHREIHERQQRTGFTVRYSKYDHKHSIPLRGYEPQAVDWVLDRPGREFEVLSCKEAELPPIWYRGKGKTRRYFPDFVIRDEKGKLCVVEVKSTYTLGLTKPDTYKNNLAKFKAAKQTLAAEGIAFKVCLVCAKRGVLWIKDAEQRSRRDVRSRLREYDLVTRK